MGIGNFDLKALLGHFRAVGEQGYGLVLDFENLEKLFYHFRDEKEILTAKHLKRIAEDPAFPMWWKMTEVSNSELAELSNLFNKISPGDPKQIWQLFDIFKNIEIESCILRILDPEHYAIFSVPVENLLNIRGKNHVEKYLNYLQDLREIGDEYGIENISDVDHALWTLTNIINSDNIRNNSIYNPYYIEYNNEPNIIKKIAARNSLKQIWRETALNLDLAILFQEEDPILAGLIASREFELIIKQMCRNNNIKLLFKTDKGIHWLNIPELAAKLRLKKVISQDDETMAITYGKLRNVLVHGAELGNNVKEEVSELIKWLHKLCKDHGIKISIIP